MLEPASPLEPGVGGSLDLELAHQHVLFLVHQPQGQHLFPFQSIGVTFDPALGFPSKIVYTEKPIVADARRSDAPSDLKALKSEFLALTCYTRARTVHARAAQARANFTDFREESKCLEF